MYRFHRAEQTRVGSVFPEAIAVAGLVLGLAGGCQDEVPIPPDVVTSTVTYRVDPVLVVPGVPQAIESAGVDRPVGVMIGPDGIVDAFVLDEVLIRVETEQELGTFMRKYNGTLLRDGSASPVPDGFTVTHVPQVRWCLVRVDLSTTAIDDLSSNIENAGVSGEVVFSSDDAARLVSIVAREAGGGVWANLLMYATSSLEHPDYSAGHLDAESFSWMQEDANVYRDGIQGLSVGVTHAWEYLEYKSVPPRPPSGGSVSWSPTRVAVVDNGFALDTSTGAPLLGNVDYFNSLSPPMQWDVKGDDNRAGGIGDVGIDGGGTSNWHGQKAVGVCCAAERNQYGTAGTGGPVAQPMPIRTGGTLYSVADAIYAGANMGAQVINISMGGQCGTLCAISDLFWDNRVGDAVIAATNAGAIVVAGAGNGGDDLDDITYLPCELLHVICVGSVRLVNSNTNDTTTDHNYGDNVAISAPTDILSTVTPDAADIDEDDFATGPPIEDELALMTGTSASTAYISGVVALMKAAKPSLRAEEARNILQATANPSSDPRIPRGYVDAYRAVLATLPNQPPTIQITAPQDGLVFGWKNLPAFMSTYNDPEVDPTDATNIYRFNAKVVYSSNLDGELCHSFSPPYTCNTSLQELSLGTHVITATATDHFGATAMHQINIEVVNRPPEPAIVTPLTTDRVYSHIPTMLVAAVPDPDEIIEEENVGWTSSIDGWLGSGSTISHYLSEGTHTLTVTAMDGKGLMGSAQRIIAVVSGNGLPRPEITAPENGILIAPGEVIELTGMAIDPEDGRLSGMRLRWSSSVDGTLGTGDSITVTLSGPPDPCYAHQEHTITLTATDSDGHSVSVKITVYVGILC